MVGGGWGGFGYGGFGYGRGLGYGGFGGGFGGWGGWGDPFWGGSDVESYTYYVSHVEMQIRRSADSRVVFEGRARARSVDHRLPNLVPNLVDALFTGFPGRSGEGCGRDAPAARKVRRNLRSAGTGNARRPDQSDDLSRLDRALFETRPTG